MTNSSKIAFITGITGQDGALLASQLLDNGWKVYGGFRRGSSNKIWRLDHLDILNEINLIECQLNEPQNLIEILSKIKPNCIYHLAGESFVADSFKYPGVTLEVNTHGTVNLLDAIRLIVPDAKVFFASSSEIFSGGYGSQLVGEEGNKSPGNPYGISKLAAQNFVSLYRERYGLFSCSGILFNHEGPLRGRQYVTRKITYNIARLKTVGGPEFQLGNLDAARDWGAADDYVKAMQLILDLDKPKDFVIATGCLTKVRDFLYEAAMYADFDPVFQGKGLSEKCIDNKSGKVIASVSEKYFRANDTAPLIGNPAKIISETNWGGSKRLDGLIKDMMSIDILRWEKGLTNV
jgi:GDPmannose 4,6-dehydratase